MNRCWPVALLLAACATPLTTSRAPALLGAVTALVPCGGAILAASQAGVARIDGAFLQLVFAPDFRVVALAVDAAGARVFCSGGAPAEAGTVGVYRDGCELLRTTLGADLVSALAYDGRDDTLVCGCDDGRVVTLDATTLELRAEVRRHAAPVRALALSGSLLASAGLDGNLMLGPRDDPPQILRDHSAGIEALAWSVDGTVLASGARDGRVRFHSPEGRLLASTEPLHARILCLGAAAAGSSFYSGDEDGVLRRHDADGSWQIESQLPDAVCALLTQRDALWCGTIGRVSSLRSAR